MPVRYSIHEKPGLLVTRVTGSLTGSDLVAALDAFVQETEGRAFYLPHLFVFEVGSSVHEVTLEVLIELQRAIERWGKVFPGRNVKTAIVVRGEYRTNIAKLWQALAEAHHSIGTHVETFEVEGDAVDWLAF